MPFGYTRAPRVTGSNQASRTRRMSRAFTTGNNGTPLVFTMFSTEEMKIDASPVAANTQAERNVLGIWSTEWPTYPGVELGYYKHIGYMRIQNMNTGADLYLFNADGFSIGVPTTFTNTVAITINNTSTDPMFTLTQQGSGDASMSWTAGAATWTWGVDNSDSDKFIMVRGTDLSTNQYIVASTTDALGFFGTAINKLTMHASDTVTNGTFGIIQSSTGDASIRLSIANTTTNWAFGIDNSDSDMFKLSLGNTLGTDDVYRINTGLSFNIIIHGSATSFTVGNTTVPNLSHLEVKGPSVGANTVWRSITIKAPLKTVSSNSTNIMYAFQVESTSGAYNISSGVVDLGARHGLVLEAFADESAFQGTLQAQAALFLRHGIQVGTGTVTNSYGVLIDFLNDGGGTVTNAWGIFQSNTAVKNYFDGPTGFGATPGTNYKVVAQKSDSVTTAIMQIIQASTGDAAFEYLLNGGQAWITGIDNSDSDKWKVSSGNALGTNDRLVIDTTGNTGVGISSPTSLIHVNGSMAAAITSVSSNTTLNTTHFTVTVDASAGNRVITLPAAAGCMGRIYNVKKIDASVNTVTVDGDGAETIDDAANTVLAAQYESVTVQSDGTEWWII